MDNIGIVFGCFIPFHKGHESLVKRALDENDRMIIAVCGYQEDRGKDFLPFTVRH
ncbi:MAG: adenylyltransferase/cytidyltransferase family protein, partial [Butyrivibrio sp.]|nr:adenylyltransferase/cytidyltransferase family protein [Butyrivibrio sp.]